jgi:nucleotide-binding universal stress UspA family protein
MTAIRQIVSGTDFSLIAHRAARRAGVLASAHGATLELLHVMDTPAAGRWYRSEETLGIVQRKVAEEAGAALASLAEDILTATGVESTRTIREGEIIKEILAAGSKADLLVLGPRGLNPVQDFVLGSTAERIARRISRPLLMVKQDAGIAYDQVLVPVDFSEYSRPALEFARALAPRASIRAYHALDCPFEGRLKSAGVSAEAIDAYRQSCTNEARASMNALLEGCGGKETMTSQIEEGDARVLIPRRAREMGCTLIVMGKQGRSWLAEYIIGSVTRVTLERAHCDVAVVPAGITA